MRQSNERIKCRILFVDDEPEFASQLIDALRDSGYIVEQVSSPDIALERLQTRNSYDLIVIDLLMPPLARDTSKLRDNPESNPDRRRSGVRLHQILREELGETKLPVIFMTVVRDPQILTEIREREKRYNRYRIMNKPIFPSDLIAEIEYLMQ